MEPVRIVLAGIGGYGNLYVKALLEGGGRVPHAFVGAVDPYPENSPYYEKLKERNIPVYPTLERFYAQSSADLAVISSPIQFHGDQTCLALANGSHVLCEKPISGNMEDVRRMIEARDRANKFVAIGYQWSFSSEIQALKQDIMSGLFGAPKRLKTLVLWPRTHRYYARSWAGKQRTADGRLILDSVANNATAHYLHNMFYVLGSGTDISAKPSRVSAELYRANDIENYDTAAMRAVTADGAELLYYGSHAVDRRMGAMFHYAFEQADVMYDEDKTYTLGRLIARFRNGETKEYGTPSSETSDKLWTCVAAVRGEAPIVCGIEAAMSQTMCIAAMQESMGQIADFPRDLLKEGAIQGEEVGTYVDGLAVQLKACYDLETLPAEAGYAWARPGAEVAVGRS